MFFMDCLCKIHLYPKQKYMNMENLMFYVLLFISITFSSSLFSQNSYEQNAKARIISDNGLKMRKTPSVNGSEITVIPFLAVVECIESSNGTENIIKKEIYNTDSKKTEMTTVTYHCESKIAGKFGLWRKVKYKQYTGWVFDGWIYYESNPHIENLHYLNDIPHIYFRRDISYIEGDNIETDCFGEMPSLYISLLNSYPQITFGGGHDSMIFDIVGVEKEDNKIKIIVKCNYDAPNGVMDIIIEKNGGVYTYECDELYRGYKGVLVPVYSYKKKILEKCSEGPP